MAKLIIRSDNTQLEIPNTKNLEITKGGLTLTLSFNDNGGVSLTQNGMAVASAPATPAQDPKPGTVMPDGTVYAGISPDTGRAFFTAAQDAPMPITWRSALIYAQKSTAHEHEDWRVPTFGELNVMFNNRTVIGGFNLNGSFPTGWYWSSSETSRNYARYQFFSDGSQGDSSKISELSVRCVRS